MADASAFEAHFQKADLDRDGRVSGAEAIQFFRGANLPQPILAKIWHAADEGQSGFLSRPQFYNALKLVTVAQSGRELTPEIIKAALVGPASAKIPAPKIETTAAATSAQPGTPAPTSTQPATPPTVAAQPALSRAPTQTLQPPAPNTPPVQSFTSSAGFGTPAWQAPARPMGVQGQLFTSGTTPTLQNHGVPLQNSLAAQRSSLPPSPSGGSDMFSTVASTAPGAAAAGRRPGQHPVAVPFVRNLHAAGPAYAAGGWPKMTPADVHRYSRVFQEVDTDKDGKITGPQARDLFLSWRLPREVLKQVWDLSEQDGDSMLSFREFCTALYMLDRFKEGRPLPSVLPAGIFLDDTQAAPAAGFNGQGWQQNPRMFQQLAPSLKPVSVESSKPRQSPKEDKVPPAEGKVLDSKEKQEFYRTKLQEIVLFKRKCDNRLNEISDRAASEKREEELMSKKYEEKYKQSAEISTRLISEEAQARELQVRKAELLNAIAEIGRGGNPNALLQTRADRISNDLDELEKALVQRGQLRGFHVKGSKKVELPFGWQPALQQNTAEWDENWDKFDDEGFTSVQDIMDQPPATTATNGATGWDDASVFGDEDVDFAAPEVNKAHEQLAVDSPRGESETSSVKSDVNSPKHDLWSPKSLSSKSPLSGPQRLSEDFQETEGRPSFASSDGFDHGPSFDSSSDHPDERPAWASAFGDAHDDVRASWGLHNEAGTSYQSFDLDFASLRAINTGESSSSAGWNESSSVPSTPLFKSASPRDSSASSVLDSSSRMNSFASVRSESDPFGDTGPFGKSSWSTF